MKIPQDADGDAMRRVIEHGSDTASPMNIDFMIACPDIASAEAIAPLAEAAGYSVSISVDKEDDSITCYCMRTMALDYDSLISCQNELDKIGRQHDGYIDGWGTFGNGPEAK
jgi:regulator of RNase E activity RraB